MAQTQMEKHLEGIINIYHQYSVRVGHYDRLSKGELKKLIEQQLPNYLKDNRDPDFFDKLLKEFDKNRDQQLSFEEFMGVLAKVLIATHEHIHGH